MFEPSGIRIGSFLRTYPLGLLWLGCGGVAIGRPCPIGKAIGNSRREEHLTIAIQDTIADHFFYYLVGLLGRHGLEALSDLTNHLIIIHPHNSPAIKWDETTQLYTRYRALRSECVSP